MPEDSPLSSKSVDALVAEFDHHSKAFKQNREAFYRHSHSACPVLHSGAHGGFTFFANYDVVLEAQRRPESFSNVQITIPDSAFPNLIPARRDPPEHAAYKMMLTRFFTPQAVARRQTLVQSLVKEYLLPCIRKGEFDIVVDVVQPIVARLTMEMLGLEFDDITVYTRPLHNAAMASYPRDRAHQEMEEVGQRLGAAIIAQRAAPRGMIGDLMAVDFGGRLLTDEELRLIVINLLNGGLGTTPLFAGSVTVFLARNPAHRQMLIDEPGLINSAIDELLRVMAPVQTFARRVTESTKLAEVELNKGDMVLLGYAAANWDPAKFADPDRIDFRRDARGHMSFGMGPHRCLGSHQAILVMRELILLLLAEAPKFEVDEAGLCSHDDIATKYGYYSVPVRVPRS